MDATITTTSAKTSPKGLKPAQSTEAFVKTLQQSRQAFNLFKEAAEKKGLLGKPVPLLKI